MNLHEPDCRRVTVALTPELYRCFEEVRRGRTITQAIEDLLWETSEIKRYARRNGIERVARPKIGRPEGDCTIPPEELTP